MKKKFTFSVILFLLDKKVSSIAGYCNYVIKEQL